MGMQTIEFKDGTKVRVDVPADATKEEIVALANQKLGRFSASEVDPDRETREQRQARLSEELGAIDYGIPTPETGVIGDLRKGFGAGFVGTGELAALGVATLLDEDAETAARDRITGIASALKPKGGDEDDLSYKIGQTFGSLAGFVAPVAAVAPVAGAVGAGVAGGIAAARGASALLGLSAAKGTASERARAQDATVEERQKAVNDLRVYLAGLVETIPIGRFVPTAQMPFIGKLINDLGPETVEGIGQRIKNAAVSGGAEAAQEVTSEILQNLTERGYNPDRAVVDSGTVEAGGLGGFAGGTLQLLIDAFTSKRKTLDVPPAEQEARELLAARLPETDGALTGPLVRELGKIEGLSSERGLQIAEEEISKIPERQGPPEPTRGEMSNVARTFVQARKKQMEEGPEFVSSRPQEVDLSMLGLGALQANQELRDTRAEIKDQLERTGKVNFDRKTLEARGIPIQTFNKIVEEEKAKIPERQGPEKSDVKDFTGFEEQLGAAVGRQKARELDGGQEPITRTEPLKLSPPKYELTQTQLEFDLQGGKSEQPVGESSPTTTSDDATGRKSDADNQQGVDSKQGDDPSASKLKPLDETRLEDNKLDAEGVDKPKAGTLPSLTQSQKDALKRLRQKYAPLLSKAKTRKAKFAINKEKLAEEAKIINLPKSTGEAPPEGFAPAPLVATQKKRSSADKIAERFYKKATPTQRRNAKEMPVTSNPFSEEVNVKLLNKISGAKDAINQYLTKYPNPADGIREAYYAVRPDVQAGAAGTKRARKPGIDKETGGRDEDPASKRQREELESGSSLYNATKTIEFIERMPMSRADRKQLEIIKANAAKDPVLIDPDVIDNIKYNGRLGTAINQLKGSNAPLEAAIDAGDINRSLDIISETKGASNLRQYANKFKQLLKGSGITLTTAKNVRDAYGDPSDAVYDPETKTITLDETNGRDAHALMHEISHALTLKAVEDNKIPKAIKDLYTEAAEEFDGSPATVNIKEFLSEAISNEEFRSDLKSAVMRKKDISYLQMVQNFIAKQILGVPRKLDSLSDFDDVVTVILSPTPPTRLTGKIGLGRRDNVKKVMQDLGEVQRKLTKDFDEKQFVNSATDFLNTSKEAPRKLFLKLVASQGLADVSKRFGFNNLGKNLDDAILAQRGKISTATEITRKKVAEVQTIFDRMGKERVEALNELIYSQDFGATIYQVDPFIDPKTALDKYKDVQSEDPNRTLLDIYNEQIKYITDNKLRGDGERAFKVMREHYKEQYERARQTVLGEIEALGKETGDPDIAKKVKKDIYDKLFKAGKLEVYFPLVREGKYKLAYKVKNSPTARGEYVLEMFPSKAERNQAAKEIKADPRYENVEPSNGDLTVKDYQRMPPTTFVNELINKLSTLKGPDGSKVPPQAIEEVMRLFVATLPETSFAKSLQPRKGTPGYKKDSLYAMRTKGYDIAVQSQKLDAASKIRAIESQIESLKKPDIEVVLPLGFKAPLSDSAFEDTKAELMSRARFAREGAKNKSIEDVGRRLNQFAFMWTIGFNASSALVNLTQIPLFVYPYLGAQYGYAQTAAAIKQAGGITLNAKNSLRDFYDIDLDGNVSVISDPKMSVNMKQRLTDLIPLVREASGRGQLISQSYLAESIGLDEASRVKPKSLIDMLSGVSAYMFNHAEKFNRQNTMIAAYNLHLQKLKDDKSVTLSLAEMQQAAADQAIYMTQEANGGAYLETGPSLARENIGRVALMYKSYGLQMYYSMFKKAFEVLDSTLTGKERVDAAKVLLGLHGSALFFAGIQGIPIYGAVKLLANAFFLDDEEEDFDTLVRKQVQEGWYKGPLVALTGLDTASRTALTGLLIQENKYNPDPSLEETLGFYLGGPALSSATRVIRGFEDFGNGQIQRGIENITPTAVSNALKSLGRYSQEGGVYSRRGDPIYDDMTTGELMGVFFGIQPAGYTQASDKNRIIKGID